MPSLHCFLAFLASFALCASATPRYSNFRQRALASDTVTNQTTCDNQQYTYQQLAGYGFVASNATDKYGDTLGGYGSAVTIDRASWTKQANGSYTGVLWVLPDRGWYIAGEVGSRYIKVLTRDAGTPKELSTTRTVSINSALL